MFSNIAPVKKGAQFYVVGSGNTTPVTQSGELPGLTRLRFAPWG